MKPARIYLRVSSDQQNLERQAAVITQAQANGYYIANIYSEKISGMIESRPEMERLIEDLQHGDTVIAESIDRITRLPPKLAENLISRIEAKGARIEVPEIFDWQTVNETIGESPDAQYLIEPILNGMQKMFLRIALNMAHDDWRKRKERQTQGIALAKEKGKYRGRQPDTKLHKKIIELRCNGTSITQTAKLLNCSVSTVSRITREHKRNTGKLNSDQADFFHKA